MEEIVGFAASLSLSIRIALVALLVSSTGVIITALNYRAGQRDRKAKSYEGAPIVKASINGTAYRDSWRSVQLHVVPVTDGQPNFSYKNWRIEQAQLLWPASAKLARAKDDDYATGVFYSENPVRAIEGKAEDQTQRFALEFFIKFDGDPSNGSKARFKVTFSRLDGQRRKTVKVWAALPDNAQPQPDVSPPAES